MTTNRLNGVLRRQRRTLVVDAVLAMTFSTTVASSVAALGQLIR